MASLALGAALIAAPSSARADNTIRSVGDHPVYPFEIEPHLLFGLDDFFPGGSYGVGARVSIPIVQNGFIPTINNSVAISFGADLLHYGGCALGNYDCGANFLFLPVAMQWNFFVAQQWSVFGEPGLFIYHGFFDTCPAAAGPLCETPDVTGLRPSLYLGGRYHFNSDIALTMRIGYPTASVGVSFM